MVFSGLVRASNKQGSAEVAGGQSVAATAVPPPPRTSRSLSHHVMQCNGPSTNRALWPMLEPPAQPKRKEPCTS
jgi:hypothetical protein